MNNNVSELIEQLRIVKQQLRSIYYREVDETPSEKACTDTIEALRSMNEQIEAYDRELSIMKRCADIHDLAEFSELLERRRIEIKALGDKSNE